MEGGAMNVYRMILVLAGVLLLAPACRAQRLSAATWAGLAKARHSRMGRANTVGLGWPATHVPKR